MTAYVGIVILNYGDPSLAKSLIRSLEPFISAQRIEICVVDNFSTSENSQNLELFCGTIDNCYFLASKDNVGYGAGNNLGLRHVFNVLGVDLAIVLNPDVEIDGDLSFDELAELSVDSECLIGGTVNQNNNKFRLLEFFPLLGISRPTLEVHDRITRPKYISGCCFGMTRSLWKLMGGFSESYFLYFEELDFIYRYRKVRGRFPDIFTLKKMEIKHFEGFSTGASANLRKMSDLAEYWTSKSRILFYRKHLSLFLLMAMGRNLFKAILLLLLGRVSNVKSILRGTYHGFRKGL